MQLLQFLLLVPVTLTLAATGTTRPPKGAVIININSDSEKVFKSVNHPTSPQAIFQLSNH